MLKALRFVVNVPIEDIVLGLQEGLSLDDISKKILQTVNAIDKSKEIGLMTAREVRRWKRR